MNAHTKPPVAADEEEAATELAIIPRETALAVLTDPEQFHAFYIRVKAMVDAFVPDLSTVTSRKAIASMARKVVTSKTMIDNAGKLLTEEWRAQTNKVDASRRAIREKLDALRDDVRRPLTEWEEAEEKRVDEVKATLAFLEDAAVVTLQDTVESVTARRIQVQAVEITDDHFQEYAAAARAHQTRTSEALTAAVARLTKEAEDRVELDRLRAAETERLAKEAADREAAEAKAAADKAAEDKRLAAEAAAKAEQERQAKAQADAKEAADRAAAKAADDARAAEAKKAADAQAERDRQHQAALDEQRKATEAAQAESKRLADEKAAADQKAEQERIAAEVRQADREHRGKVMAAAKEALMALGAKEDLARKIILGIVAGEIPAVSLAF
jgi:hypothetical protein